MRRMRICHRPLLPPRQFGHHRQCRYLHADHHEKLQDKAHRRIRVEVALPWREFNTYYVRIDPILFSESSTLSRHIGKIDAKAKNSDKLRDRLNGYINALIQACPLYSGYNTK
jgi:hypothetical protein